MLETELTDALQGISRSEELVEFIKRRFPSTRRRKRDGDDGEDVGGDAKRSNPAPDSRPDIDEKPTSPEAYVAKFLPAVIWGEDNGFSSAEAAARLHRREAEARIRALHKAAWCGDRRAIPALVRGAGDVDARAGPGELTALHHAVLGCWEPNGGRGVETAQVLLKSQAYPDARDAEGRTPLYYAARRNQLGFLRLLLEAAADVNTVANNGSSPLHAAAEAGHVACVTLLLDCGAEESTGKGGVVAPCGTALHWAARRGRLEAVKALVAAGEINVVCLTKQSL